MSGDAEAGFRSGLILVFNACLLLLVVAIFVGDFVRSAREVENADRWRADSAALRLAAAIMAEDSRTEAARRALTRAPVDPATRVLIEGLSGETLDALAVMTADGTVAWHVGQAPPMLVPPLEGNLVIAGKDGRAWLLWPAETSGGLALAARTKPETIAAAIHRPEHGPVLTEVLSSDGRQLIVWPPEIVPPGPADPAVIHRIGIADALGLSRAEWLITDSAAAPLGMTVRLARPIAQAISLWRQRVTLFALIVLSLGVLLAVAGRAIHRREVQLAYAAEQAELEARLASRAREELSALFDTVTEGIVIFDIDSPSLRVTPEAMRLLGAPSAEAALARLVSLYPEVGRAQGNVRMVLTGAEFSTVEGETRIIDCSVSQLTNDRRVTKFCIVSDADERRKLEHARTRFVASVNHELRTPLASLKGALDVIDHHLACNAAVRPMVGIAQRNSDRLMQLVDDILTVQAIDGGGLSLSWADINAGEVMNEIAESIATHAASFGVSIEVRETLRETVLPLDRLRIQQVLTNLLSNAARFTPEGGAVETGVRRRGDEVEFWVRDRGPGIPVRLRDRLFARFARGPEQIPGRGPGTGLGLAISRELVERMGGRIGYDTRTAAECGPGETTGTTFTATFHIGSAAHARADATAAEDA